MRSRAFALVLAGCAACLFPDLSPLSGDDAGGSDVTQEGPNDGGPSNDQEAGPPKCDPSAPFSSIQPIAELDDSNSQFKATLTPDELDIWYGITQATDAGSVTQIVHASRQSTSLPFGNPTVEANIAPDDVDPAVSDDGLTMYYAKFGSIGDWDLFGTGRATRSDPFSIGFQLQNALQSKVADTAPFVAFDRSLYFLSKRVTGNNHVWVAPFTDGGLGAPVEVTSLASPANELGVVLTHDGLWAYVSSDRTDLPNAGDYDTYLAHRTSTSDDFGAAVNVTELNSAFEDRANWISWDNCRLYFESERSGGGDLFVATKTP